MKILVKSLLFLFLPTLFWACEPSTSPNLEAESQTGLTPVASEPKKVEMSHSNLWMPVTRTSNITCANGGEGELVDFSGELHFLVRSWTDAKGGLHFKEAVNLNSILGLGQTTGDTYRINGTTEEQYYIGPGGLPVTYTILNPGIGIGPDPDVRFRVNVSLKVTINKNGEFTVFQERIRIECIDVDI